MKKLTPINFRRARGIVWVCDLAKSSSYLNHSESVDDIEEFIPRLYYASKILVESFGGIFMKWTGDGFLAFFEIEVDRRKESAARRVFEAAWHLTFMSNVTQLGLKPKRKFKIRHGITYEKDALMMTINNKSNGGTLDIIGRSVVLAFRLSGIESKFPSIVTVNELVEKNNKEFIKWKPSVEEKLKFFKGERFGTDAILVSADKPKKRKISLKRNIQNAKKTISSVESPEPLELESPISIFTQKMSKGPKWCREVIIEEANFIETELLGSLKKVVDVLEKHQKNGL